MKNYKLSRAVDTHRNVSIRMPKPESFMGMVVEKSRTLSTCVGIEPYVNKEGVNTNLLLWEVVWKESGKKILRKTASGNFRASDLPSTERAFLNEQADNQ